MNTIREHIIKVIKMLDNYSVFIVANDESKNDTMSYLLGEFTTLYKEIMFIYEQEAFVQYSDDKAYWMEQFKRILSAFEGNDEAFLFDVINFEMIKSLEYLVDMIGE